jgi:hypothetical protein
MGEKILKYTVVTKFKTPQQMMDINDWCVAHFGDRYQPATLLGHWSYHWRGPTADYGTGYKWRFRKEKDAMLFALKWS